MQYDAAESVIAFAHDWRKLTPDDQEWRHASARTQPVDHTRNVIVKECLSSDIDVLVWQDSDVGVPDPKDYGRLVTSLLDMPIDVGILGVPVIKQSSEGAPCMNFVMGSAHAKPDPREPFEVLAIGFGLVAVRAEVYRAMSPPFHRFEYDVQGNLAIGEDIGFCDRARSLGWRVMVEPRIDARHTFPRAHSVIDKTQDQWNALAR